MCYIFVRSVSALAGMVVWWWEDPRRLGVTSHIGHIASTRGQHGDMSRNTGVYCLDMNMLRYEQGQGIAVAALVCRYRVSPGRGFIRRSLKQPHRHLGEWCRLPLVSAVTTVTIHPGDSLYFYLQWWRVDILSIVWPGVGSRLGADLEPGHHSGVATVASG